MEIEAHLNSKLNLKVQAKEFREKILLHKRNQARCLL